MTDAKPCPNQHCKSTDLVVQKAEKPGGGFSDHRIRCLKCGVMGPRGVVPGQAKAAWNDMPREPEIGPNAIKAARKLAEVLDGMIHSKVGHAGVYLVCADGAMVSSEFLMCVTDARDVVYESKARDQD